MKIRNLIICIFIFFQTACAQKNIKMDNKELGKGWEKVKQLEKKGLPESALEEVEKIYSSALEKENWGELVKAIIHKLKYTSYKEENAFVKNLIKLKKEAETATYPAKPLLHSMLGEMYWSYYQNNRYRFNQRSQIAGIKQDDIETWSLQKIVEETFRQYQLSLDDSEKSKEIAINIYDEVLAKGGETSREIRPTIFDFLAHRAIAFFSNPEPDITKPASTFMIDDAQYLAEAFDFVDLEIASDDTLSMKYHALKIYQELIQLHLEDEDPKALVEVDLQRLEFVKNNSIIPNKEELYLKTLQKLEKETIESPVSTKVTHKIALSHQLSGYQYKPLISEDHKWDLKKAIELCDAGLQRFPDSDGAILCENLKIDITKQTIESQIEKRNIPNQPFRAFIRYNNLDKINYRVVKIDRTDVQELREDLSKKHDINKDKEFIKYFLDKSSLKTGNYSLPNDGDFQSHSLEIKIDALPVGEYMLIFSSDENFNLEKSAVVYSFITVTNISYIHRNHQNGDTDFYVVHRETGEPLQGVEAEVFRKKYESQKGYYFKKEGTLKSDGNGYIQVEKNHKPGVYDYGIKVNFSKGDDFVSTDEIGQGYSYYSSSYSGQINQYITYPPTTGIQTFFFLDRSIYRPGQTIYFKGLVLMTDGKKPETVKNRDVIVTLYDVNNQPKGDLTLKSNEYGTFSGIFTAPSSGLTGQMSLKTNSTLGQASFSVEEYKRPKFQVNFNPLKGSFKLNETIKVTGNAQAFSGANIDGAEVKYRVVRNASFPYWFWYRWGFYPSSPQIEIVNGATKTDEKGQFEIDFKAIPDLSIDKKVEPTFSYTIYADVTDINGETHSSSKVVYVGYKALTLNIPVSNIDTKVGKDTFDIYTQNLAGEFEPAAGEITIWKLKGSNKTFRDRYWNQPDLHLYSKEEYYQLFPHDLYEDENNKFKWEKEKKVFSTSFNTKNNKKLTLNDLEKWDLGEYVLEISSKDKYGESVQGKTYFQVFSSEKKSVPVKTVNYSQALKTKAEPGEEATILFGTSEEKINALYELELDGKIINKERVELNREQKIFKVDIEERHRGNLIAHYMFVKHNRLYTNDIVIQVPYTNKVLDIEFATFRDKLQPGQEEQWKIIVKGKNKEKIAAEMVATLYDESLDQFRAHGWYQNFYTLNYSKLNWQTINDFKYQAFTSYFPQNWHARYKRYPKVITYDQLNWFGYNYYNYYYRNARFNYSGNLQRNLRMAPSSVKDGEFEEESDVLEEVVSTSTGFAMDADGTIATERSDMPSPQEDGNLAKNENQKVDLSNVKVRTNFNETAFFYPHLQTNANGEIIINFTIPEALTKWKMLGFAHTQDMKTGSIVEHLVTQKNLMVVPNQPRFFRENDKMIFSTKISSLVDKNLSGQVELQFFDAITMKPVDIFSKGVKKGQSFATKPKQSTTVEWEIAIPEGIQAITYRVVAKAGNFSDGEERMIPVVTNRMLVTETLPLPIRGKQTKTFEFEKLLNNTSKTLKHQKYTLEYTSNPAWYAVQALPYLMEYPYECVEQTFSRYYANAIASHIANSNPKIKRVFDTWKNIQPDALLSNLEKNQELKTALLEETPWVLQAQSETQRKRMIGVLFDLNRMANELEIALNKIQDAQYSSGGFSWFPGLPENRYMTQHITAGMGHLDVLGVKSIKKDSKTWSMVTKALNYLDTEIRKDYQRLKDLAKQKKIKLEDNHISYIQYHYLYTRSYFKEVEVSKANQEAFEYFLNQAKEYWIKTNLYAQGMACLALHQFDEGSTSKEMIRSFSERALHSEEMGMYWKSSNGYFWYQAPIETQALMIEVYDVVAEDQKAVEELKTWLLKQKQTQDWKTTKATVEACYALLRRGTDILANDNLAEISIGGKKIDPKEREDTNIEAGTGYFKTSWNKNEISTDMGRIEISKKEEGVAWGAVYWQYFEQLDKITPAETPLKLKKELFLQKNTDRGQVIVPINEHTKLSVGDLVKVRIELRVDRDMEYVHLKDMRASSFEPVSTISRHKYQDGLYYYENPRDLATNFFIGYLPKGTYVFEYPLRVSQKGDFSNGITTIQSMYAPEFTSHSEGIRVSVE